MRYQGYDTETHEYLWQKGVNDEIEKVYSDGYTADVYGTSSSHNHVGFLDISEDRCSAVSLCANCQ